MPFYLRSNVFTMPEFLERRFNRNCATYLASISVIAYIFTKISVHLYAAGIVLERVVGWNQWTAAIILVIATGIYTIAGGLAAVIYTDLVQTLILLAGAIALTLIGMDKVGGFAGPACGLPDSFFHMMKPARDPDFPWTGIVFGAPILGIWYWCTDQVIVQRVLSARDEGHAKAGTIFAGFLKILPVFLLVLPGLICYALYPQLFTAVDGKVTNGDIAFPSLVINLLPAGLVGLLIAALLAALMGAMSSFSIPRPRWSRSIYKKYRPAAIRKQLVNFGRIATGAMVVLGFRGSLYSLTRARSSMFICKACRPTSAHPSRCALSSGILWPRLNGEGAQALAAGWLRVGRGAFDCRGAGQDRTLQRHRGSLAGGHQLSSLRRADVCHLHRGTNRRQHDVSGPPRKKLAGFDVCDCWRQARKHGRANCRTCSAKRARSTRLTWLSPRTDRQVFARMD